jgi:hypothetical protein
LEVIYDATTQTLTQTRFVNGSVIDLNANGQILWEDGFDTYLDSVGVTRPVSDLFPLGSGWSSPLATRISDSGRIVGHGGLQTSGSNGFMLTPTPVRILRGKLDDMKTIILWGVINCGPGVVIIGGHLVRIPPHGPLNELMAALPEALRNELTPIIKDARFSEPAEVQDFRRRVTSVVDNYSRRTFGSHDGSKVKQ